MTTIRPSVTYEGLEISITSNELKPFYLTGDTPLFILRVHNPGKEKRKGKLALTWKLLRLETKRIIPIDVPPGKTEEYNIQKEWLYTQGMGRYDLKIIGPPENYIDAPDESIALMLSKLAFGIHPLISYYVRDKETYEYEKAERGQKIKLDRSLYRYTVAICMFTVGVFVFTALIFLKEFGVDYTGLWSKFIKLITGT